MKYRNRIWIVLCFAGILLWQAPLQAQQKTEPPNIAVIARPRQDSILLRWAPATPMLWKMANQYGYTIKRYTILRKGQLLPVPEETLLTTRPLKPLPLPAWEGVVKKQEKYGAIAAQALYGEGFEVSAPQQHKGRDIMSIYHQAQELEARHSFMLLSADLSFEVACAAGLGYVDKQVRPDEKYLYRIFITGTPPEIKRDTGFVFTGYADAAPAPAPHGLEAQAVKTAVLLSWDKTMYERLFVGYIIERSENGGATYHAINQEPVINTSSAADTGRQQRFFRVDTVQLEQPLVYRIRGITSFGELSPPSDTVHITVAEELQARPSITGAGVVDGKVWVQWMMPPGKARITGFQVERAPAVNKPYLPLTKRLPAGDTAFTDNAPRSSNYYRIKAFTKDGQASFSLPYFVQLEDSLPPAPPAGLVGQVDDKGIVQLQWQPNQETDLYAYRVFRANDSTVEFVQVTKEPIKATRFTDTIEIKTLTREVYYKLVALDGHYNPSAFSPVLTLRRPDVVPPVPPAFTAQRSEVDGIYLQWQRSTSKDVARHELLRSTDTGWQPLLRVPVGDTLHAFTDTSAVPGRSYRYCVAAVDSSQLRSLSQPLTAARINMGSPAVKNALKAVIDREHKSIVLRWQVPADVTQLWLYKAIPGQPFRLYRTLEPGEKELEDTGGLFINTAYRYKMKVFRGTSGDSFFTETITVNY
ncbi:hypothetical protein F0L74_21000 [Chitinophaga agrisoli]|uniref:Fibronectin type-III domain-containing protein n=1 Tax=Chitinophaga agrisoli TaxID=2607653 RepID=A0A5B2VKC5_9BACT|nr:hypothetical protein [Chitinophaga agrisoli]KAA2238699.1 hypothetical protein F0L74_21000 [Chitinophaga agrisoli]